MNECSVLNIQDASMQDTSLLVDVCRQSIVFEDLTGLADCLRAIQQDPHTDIVRVKNRLDPAFDSGLSLGYRDIAINMRVVNSETIELGVENHVCEVQLLLKPMAELKASRTLEHCLLRRRVHGFVCASGCPLELLPVCCGRSARDCS